MKWLAVLSVVAIVGGAVWVHRDPGHIPAFDARLQRLAETDLQGYCAGVTFWQVRRLEGDAERAADCRERTDRPDTVNYSVVVTAFCRGASDAGFPGDPKSECEDVLNGRRIWPTYNGGITADWNRAHPYPGDTFGPPPPTDDGRRHRDDLDMGGRG